MKTKGVSYRGRKRIVMTAAVCLAALLIVGSFSGLWIGVPIVQATPDHTITVTGKFTFANGEPIRHAYVEVYDDDGGYIDPLVVDDLKASGYTDGNGHYYITGVDNVDYWYWVPLFGRHNVYGIDVYVRCYSENWKVRVLGNPEWMSWNLFEGGFYRFSSDKRDDVKDGSIVNLGTKDAPSDEDEAFNVFDTLNKGYDFLVHLGLTPPQVKAFWDDWFTPANSYCLPWYVPYRYYQGEDIIKTSWQWLIDLLLPRVNIAIGLSSLVGIHIKDGDGWKEDHVLHELGHWVMDTYAEFWPPDTVLEHYATIAYNPQHALGEGWADFFSAAVRQWAGYSISDYTFCGVYDIEGRLLSVRIGGILYNILVNYEGDSVEASVAGILWDIFDDQNEPGDELALGFNPVWDTLINYDPEPGSS